MNEKRARTLVSDYTKGWLAADHDLILSTLCNECIIVESHGPTYAGKGQVKQWADEWFQTGTVDQWDIRSFAYSDHVVFFEWFFSCTINHETSSIYGASFIRFKDDKICSIHEYRMTQPAYEYFS